MANGHNKPSDNVPIKPAEEEDGESDDVTTEEVASLCATMDQLDSCLDDIERKNDSLNAKLRDLLQSMKDDKDDDHEDSDEEDQEKARDQTTKTAAGNVTDVDNKQ